MTFKRIKYIVFPCELFKGFAESGKSTRRCLDDALHFAMEAFLRKYSISKDDFSEAIRIGFGINGFPYSTRDGFRRANREIIERYFDSEKDYPFFSMKIETFLDFYLNDKEPFEKEVLLAYLAAKSIIGKRDFVCTNKSFLASRMDGNVTYVEELSPSVAKYQKRYHFDRLLEALFMKYNLAIFTSKKLRGVYLSLIRRDDGTPDIVKLRDLVLKRKVKSHVNRLRDAIRKAENEDST